MYRGKKNLELPMNFKLLKIATTTKKQPTLNLSVLKAWSVHKEVCLLFSQSSTGQILLPQISFKTCLLYLKSYLFKRASRKDKIDSDHNTLIRAMMRFDTCNHINRKRISIRNKTKILENKQNTLKLT